MTGGPRRFEIDTIDPDKSVTIVGSQVWPNIFEGLVMRTLILYGYASPAQVAIPASHSDPDDFFYQWHHTGEVFNLWRYSDPEMDALLEQGRTTVDQEQRKQIYYRIQEKLINDVPLVHIIYRDQIMATNVAVQNFPMRLDSPLHFRETWFNR